MFVFVCYIYILLPFCESAKNTHRTVLEILYQIYELCVQRAHALAHIQSVLFAFAAHNKRAVSNCEQVRNAVFFLSARIANSAGIDELLTN